MTVSTAIFMDYDNLYRSINESYSQFETSEVVKKIIHKMEELGSNSVQLVKAFCDFHTATDEINELQNNLVELKHVNSVGEGKSNASDIALAIDVTKSLYENPKFEHYVIVSSDSDMLPIIMELVLQGKKTTLFYLESKIKTPYLNTVRNKIDIVKIEDVLEVETYTVFDIERLKEKGNRTFQVYLDCINHTMNELFVKYHEQPATVIYQKNIIEALKNNVQLEIQPSDAMILFDYLKEEKLIFSADVHVMMHGVDEIRKAFFINEKRVKEFGLTLSEEVLVKYENANLVHV